MVTAGVGIEGIRAQVEELRLVSQRLAPLNDANSAGGFVVEVFSLHAKIKDVYGTTQSILEEWDVLTPNLKDRLRRIAEEILEQWDGAGPAARPIEPRPRRRLFLLRLVIRALEWRVREGREMLLDISNSILARLEMEDEAYGQMVMARLSDAARAPRPGVRLESSEEVVDYVSAVLRD